MRIRKISGEKNLFWVFRNKRKPGYKVKLVNPEFGGYCPSCYFYNTLCGERSIMSICEILRISDIIGPEIPYSSYFERC